MESLTFSDVAAINQGLGPEGDLAMRAPTKTIAAELNPRERMALFCIAAKTRSGATTGVRTRLIVRGLIERRGSEFVLTDEGCAVLMTLIAG